MHENYMLEMEEEREISNLPCHSQDLWEERKGSRGHSRLSERGQATSAREENGSALTEQASEATVLVGVAP